MDSIISVIDSIMDSMMSFWVFLIALYIYLLPSAIAAQRQSCMTGAIFFLNLIFGWTIVIWIVCFIWACTTDR